MPLIRPQQRLTEAINDFSCTIGNWRASITPTIYFNEKMAIIKENGNQLPGTENDRFFVEQDTPNGDGNFTLSDPAIDIPTTQDTKLIGCPTPKADITP